MKIGIVGNGMIVNMFLHDAKTVEHAEIVSICVRPKSLEKGQKLAGEYGIPLIETDYEEFLKNPNIDTVYIGISNLLHHEYVKKALLAGKHVICEKPFTVTGAEAKELAEIATKKHLFLWEAFIIPYAPAYEAVRRYLPEVGNVKLVQCNYCKISSRYSQYLSGVILPAFDLSLAGGALYDLNIYNLHFAVDLFGKAKSVRYAPNKGYNGVDTSGVALLGYDDFQVVCCAAKDSTSPSGAVIQGDQGTLRVEGAVSAISKIILSKDGKETVVAQADGSISLAYELTEFIRQYEAKDYDSCYRMLEHSVAVTELVDELLK